jgi:hypothetical protein
MEEKKDNKFVKDDKFGRNGMKHRSQGQETPRMQQDQVM